MGAVHFPSIQLNINLLRHWFVIFSAIKGQATNIYFLKRLMKFLMYLEYLSSDNLLSCPRPITFPRKYQSTSNYCNLQLWTWTLPHTNPCLWPQPPPRFVLSTASPPNRAFQYPCLPTQGVNNTIYRTGICMVKSSTSGARTSRELVWSSQGI